MRYRGYTIVNKGWGWYVYGGPDPKTGVVDLTKQRAGAFKSDKEARKWIDDQVKK